MKRGVLIQVLVNACLAVLAAASEPDMKARDSAMATLRDANASLEAVERAIAALGTNVDSNGVAVLTERAVSDGNVFVRRKAFGRLIEHWKAGRSEESSCLEVFRAAGRDADGQIRAMACQALLKRPNEKAVQEVMEVLAREFAKKPGERGEPKNIRLPKAWAPDTVISACMEGMRGLSAPAVRVVEERFASAAGDLKYALAHVLCGSGKAPDSMILAEGVGKTTSKHVKVLLLYDLAAIKDERVRGVLEEALKDETAVEGKEGDVIYPVRLAAQRALDVLKKK